jgi:hypothetical protein
MFTRIIDSIFDRTSARIGFWTGLVPGIAIWIAFNTDLAGLVCFMSPFVGAFVGGLVGIVSRILPRLVAIATARLGAAGLLAVVVAILTAAWWLWSKPPDKLPTALQVDTFSMSVLAGSLLALTWVTFMRFYMRRALPSGSRLIVAYKIWHYPVFVAANLFKPPFILLVLAVLICVTLVALGIVLGYILGAAAGRAGAIIGAAIAVFGSALLCEPIVSKMGDRAFMDALRHDMLSASPNLLTVNRDYLFPFLCVIQSTILFGSIGSLVGNVLASTEVSPVTIGAVSAFFAFFCAQLLSRAKQSVPTGIYRVSLGVIQGVVVGLLLLPAKNLLAQNHFAASMLDQLAQFCGDQLGLGAVFVSIMGLGTGALGSLGKRDT